MARPTKQGIDYFPVDVDLDNKVELFIAETGAAGWGVLVSLWQMIYRDNGYYIEYSEDLFLMIRRQLMIDIDEAKEIVDKAIHRNLFDQPIFERHKVLTSKGIQDRFFIAARKKKVVYVVENWLLTSIEGVNNISLTIVSGVGNSTKEEEEVKEEVEVKEDNYTGVETPAEFPPQRDPCPYEKIINLYHEKLPMLPRVAKLTDARKRSIRARWNNGMYGIDNWSLYFDDVAQSRFLTGKVDPSPGRKQFFADIDFLISERTIVKMQEGKYHD